MPERVTTGAGVASARLSIRRTPGRLWSAEVITGRGAVRVGLFPTWAEAWHHGCVAGRLQAAGVSWTPAAPVDAT